MIGIVWTNTCHLLAAMRRPLLIAVVFLFGWMHGDADAQTRRAFVVGITKYTDNNLQALERAANDASDIAKDLEDLDFKKENIKVENEIKSKDDFLKKFNDFLKNVKPGDEIFFFYSGHGYASASDNSNYLLFTNLKSLISFTKDKLPKDQANNAAVVASLLKQYEVDYESAEIQKSGISEREIRRLIAAKSPAVAILVLDACRTLYTSSDGREDKVRRGLFHAKDLPPGFLVFYSGSYGQESIERLFWTDRRHNSLFTDILRTAIKRPGFEIRDLVKQVTAQVTKAARSWGHIQVPDFEDTLTRDFRFIPSIGAERFPIDLEADRCRFAADDWAGIERAPTLTKLRAHLQQFAGCGYDKRAQAKLNQAGQGSDEIVNSDPSRQRLLGSLTTPTFSECDQLAASEFDTKRPSEVPGVPFDQIGGEFHDTARAIDVCQAAALSNAKIERYRFNLARALNAHALRLYDKDPDKPDQEVRQSLNKSFAIYKELASNGYVAAINNLAVFYDNDLIGRKDPAEAVRLYKLASQQGLPLAMYNLAIKFKFGVTDILQPDRVQAREWMTKAREAGLIAAGIEEAEFLLRGNEGTQNPRAALELLQQAADAGSTLAKRKLGQLYQEGAKVNTFNSLQDVKDTNKVQEQTSKRANFEVPQSEELALLWFGRAAEAGDAFSQMQMAKMLEDGRGLAGPQVALAERYWRAAAQNGNTFAQVQLATRILDHRILSRSENTQSDFADKLKLAMISGQPRAALLLANSLARSKPKLAITYAFKAIELAAFAYPESTAEVNDAYLSEIAAGQLLVKIGRDPNASDAQGRPLLLPIEVDRLETYYGKYDPVEGGVKVSKLMVPDFCAVVPKQAAKIEMQIWDWGRKEAPTEQQFRNLALWHLTCYWDLVREYVAKDASKRSKKAQPAVTESLLNAALSNIFEQSKKYNVNYAELLQNKIKSLPAEN